MDGFANREALYVDISWLKASAVYSFWKTCNVNKTSQLKPGKGDGIWWVIVPHQDKLGAIFCFQVAEQVPDIFYNFYSVKNHKIVHNAAITEAREKK